MHCGVLQWDFREASLTRQPPNPATPLLAQPIHLIHESRHHILLINVGQFLPTIIKWRTICQDLLRNMSLGLEESDNITQPLFSISSFHV
jgi:hypothetical protein